MKLSNHRAILLYSSLDEFIISCCKKLPEADTKVRWMAQHLIHGTQLQQELEVPTNYKFHFLESCVIAWYAQMEWYAVALANDDTDSLRSLDMNILLASPQNTVTACAKFLQFNTSPLLISERVLDVFSRNSKDSRMEYNPTLRAKERENKRKLFARELEISMQWAQESIAPFALLPTKWKPLFGHS